MGATVVGALRSARRACSGRRSWRGSRGQRLLASVRRRGGGRRRGRGGLGGLAFEFVRVAAGRWRQRRGPFRSRGRCAEARCGAVPGGLAGGAFGRLRGGVCAWTVCVTVVGAWAAPDPLVLLWCPWKSSSHAAASSATATRPIWYGRESWAIEASFGNSATEVECRHMPWTFAPLRSLQEMSDSDGDQGPSRRPGRRRLWALTVVLLTCLAAAACDSSPHARVRPSAGAPRAASEPPRCPKSSAWRRTQIGGLREDVARALPQRVGRLYEEGTVQLLGRLERRRTPPPASSPRAAAPGGYEMRWWAPNGDDVVADVLVFASRGASQALPGARVERSLSRAGGPRPACCTLPSRTTSRG